METNEQNDKNFRISVPTAFEDVFSYFYFAENNTDKPITKTLFPSYQTILIFSFGSKVSFTSRQNTKIEADKCLVLGPIKQAFEYSLPAGSEILVANFKADAFYRFFGKVLLSDRLSFHPDELLDENCFTNLWYQLKEMPSASEKVDFILEFCKPYLRNWNTTSELLSAFEDETLNPIKVIAHEIHQSERSVQLNHKKIFRYSAKEINRYHRFLKAAELIRNIASNSAKMDWFEIIEQCRYYDQSQLIHDFKHFIHLSPKQFLKFQQDICFVKPE